MKKILFLISRFLDGGIDSVLLSYLRTLAQSGKHELTLGIGIQMDELEVFHSQIPTEVNVVYLLPTAVYTSLKKARVTRRLSLSEKILDEVVFNSVRSYKRDIALKKLTRDNDIVIDFDSTFYTALRKCDNVKKIAFFHFSFKKLFQQNPRRVKRIASGLSHYDNIVTISDDMANEGRELFPALSDKIVRIYNSMDKNYLIQKSNEYAVNEANYLLAVQRLEESQKDNLTLIKAYHQLVNRYKISEKLILLGDGKDRMMLEQVVSDLKLSGNIVFKGFQPNPYPWIKNCSVLILSSKFEGLPTILIEGLMMRKLIVASDCPTGPREILANGSAGILSKVADADDLAQSIYSVLSDNQIKDRLKTNTLKQSEEFSSKRMLAAFEQLLG